MTSILNNNSYYQTKTPIGFWYKGGLNLKSLIQPSETLSVELTETHILEKFSHTFKRNIKNSQKINYFLIKSF